MVIEPECARWAAGSGLSTFGRRATADRAEKHATGVPAALAYFPHRSGAIERDEQYTTVLRPAAAYFSG
jgi:hypothetical protein